MSTHPWTVKAAQHSWAGGSNETATAANAALRVPLLCWASILHMKLPRCPLIYLWLYSTQCQSTAQTHSALQMPQGVQESPLMNKTPQKSTKTIQRHGGVLARSNASARSSTTASSTTSLPSLVHHAKALSSTNTSSFCNDAIYFNKLRRKKGPFRRLKRSVVFET